VRGEIVSFVPSSLFPLLLLLVASWVVVSVESGWRVCGVVFAMVGQRERDKKTKRRGENGQERKVAREAGQTEKGNEWVEWNMGGMELEMEIKMESTEKEDCMFGRERTDVVGNQKFPREGGNEK